MPLLQLPPSLSLLQVGQIVEALVLKYVALTHEELEEWRDDPEGYIRCVLCFCVGQGCSLLRDFWVEQVRGSGGVEAPRLRIFQTNAGLRGREFIVSELA